LGRRAPAVEERPCVEGRRLDGDYDPEVRSRPNGALARADLVLTGGAVHTVDRALPKAEAVAVAAGRVIFVGSADDARALAGPDTRILELGGRTVLPGFQDAHIHPAAPLGGVSELRCNLYRARSREECLAEIARYAAADLDREWVSGGGWSIDSFPGGIPRKEDLDAIVPDRPVYLRNRDGHGAWVNSRALELAGVTAATPDPDDGRIERDEHGSPVGALQEGAADLVGRLVPPPTAADWREGILRAQALAHAVGITAWQDAKVTAETLAAHRALADRGKLTMRTEGNLYWDHDRGDEQLDELIELRAQGTAGRLRIRGAKLFQDGILENFTAGVLEPYAGGGSGLSLFEPGRLKVVVAALDREGFQVHVHAIGDRAVREALDAGAGARRANGARDARHHVCHLQLVHPDDQPRFAALGVVANCQALWACRSGYVEDLTLPFISPAQAATLYPFGSLHRAGARLAMGSDWTVSTQDPLAQIEVAVARVHPESRGAEPLLPGEALELETAVEAFTLGSAHVNHLDGETGSIVPGKLADLAVLDRDLFDRGAGPIADARVVLTLVAGEAVHGELSLDG
jgi:predicted amidohydrolase YtcJ